MPDSLIALVGLGNPGPDYAETRHNAGFWLLDKLAQSASVEFRPDRKFHGEITRLRIGPQSLILLKPSTWMNRSGQAVSALCNFYKIPTDNLVVAHDELDLPVGTVRFKQGGGHGGHNGLRDIHKPLGPDYRRIRIGVGHPGSRELVMRYLTESRPSRAERESIDLGLEATTAAIDTWMHGSWDKAVQALHSSR